jgi:phosphotransacetylase
LAGLFRSFKPPFECEGELHGDAALSKDVLEQVFPGAAVSRKANLLVMPTMDAANITVNVLKTTPCCRVPMRALEGGWTPVGLESGPSAIGQQWTAGKVRMGDAF